MYICIYVQTRPAEVPSPLRTTSQGQTPIEKSAHSAQSPAQFIQLVN